MAQPNLTPDMKVLKYLENQLKLMREQLKSFEMPLDIETIKDIRKVEEMILKNKIWMMEQHIEAIKMILDAERDKG